MYKYCILLHTYPFLTFEYVKRLILGFSIVLAIFFLSFTFALTFFIY